MHHFKYLHDELHCENLPLNLLVEKFRTPFYLYSKNTLLDNFKRMRRAFRGVEHLICFALKANSNPTFLSMLAQNGAGADVVSGGEIYLALKNGFPPEKIVYAGVGKTEEEIRYTLREKILAFNVESRQELELINTIAQNMETRAPVGLRINPDIDIQGHPYISTGKAENKFGIDVPEAKRMVEQIAVFPNIDLIGLHCHIGSQITALAPFVQTIRTLKALTKEWLRKGIRFQYIDIGGGLGVKYQDVFDQEPDERLTVEDLADALLPDLRDLDCKIIFEPGRSLVAEAGILVTKVLYTKETRDKRFVIVDAGMNDLLRPSLYGAYHEIVPLKKVNRKTEMVDVVGPICETGDFLARNRALPEPQRGDFMAVMTTGAYGFSLTSNYNARPRPAEILVDGKEYRVIREREKIAEFS